MSKKGQIVLKLANNSRNRYIKVVQAYIRSMNLTSNRVKKLTNQQDFPSFPQGSQQQQLLNKKQIV